MSDCHACDGAGERAAFCSMCGTPLDGSHEVFVDDDIGATLTLKRDGGQAGLKEFHNAMIDLVKDGVVWHAKEIATEEVHQ